MSDFTKESHTKKHQKRVERINYAPDHQKTIHDPPGPYKELCGRPLTETEEAEMTFNLVNFMETLIAMDRQHQDWLEKQKDQPKQSA